MIRRMTTGYRQSRKRIAATQTPTTTPAMPPLLRWRLARDAALGPMSAMMGASVLLLCKIKMGDVARNIFGRSIAPSQAKKRVCLDGEEKPYPATAGMVGAAL